MRIIAGKYKGRKIITLDDKSLRPTMGKAREAIFNILSHGEFATEENKLLDGCNVLDLFCGCGTLAAEALSRGAGHVVLVDIEQKHLEVARQNITHLGEEKHASFIRADSSNPPPARVPCHLVFIDPPYKSELAGLAMKNIIRGNWLADGAVLVVETGLKDDFTAPECYTELDSRKYGNCRIRIYRYRKK